MSEKARFGVELDVRDYECDLQGVVNNAVYQNYLEHVRHLFLKSRGIDFADLVSRGINLVVTRVEMDYLSSLRSGERFRVEVTLERVSRLRFGFRQTISRLPEGVPVLRALVTGTALDARDRPHLPPEIGLLLEAVPCDL